VGGVIRDAAGNLYGTTFQGGTAGLGVVYKVDPSGHQTVLHNFTGTPDGSLPMGDLVRDSAGNLYGTANAGGGVGCGVVYKLAPGGQETVLWSFTGAADGCGPTAGVIRDLGEAPAASGEVSVPLTSDSIHDLAGPINQIGSANVRRLEDMVSFEKVYAPFDGVITVRNTDTGVGGTGRIRTRRHLTSHGSRTPERSAGSRSTVKPRSGAVGVHRLWCVESTHVQLVANGSNASTVIV
jgi:uncharacterized repeat protein (TIGR03803 family)